MRLKGQLPQQPVLRHHHDEHDLDFDDEHFDEHDLDFDEHFNEHFNDHSHYLYFDEHNLNDYDNPMPTGWDLLHRRRHSVL